MKIAVELPAGRVASQLVSGCGAQHLVRSESGQLHVWDLVSGRTLLQHVAHAAPVTSLSCHPNRPEQLLTASHDGTVKLWSAPAG